MAIRYAAQKPPEKIEKHCTPLDLARRLVALVPLRHNDVVVDPAGGKNLVFYRAFPRCRKAYDIENGDDFLALPLTYDWAITKPPYHLLWKFIEKASSEAREGFASLVNINGINTLTPKRLAFLEEHGFHMRHLHVVNIKAWLGKYYFYVFGRNPGPCALSWDVKSWEH